VKVIGSPEAIQPPMTLPTNPSSSAVTAPMAALRVAAAARSCFSPAAFFSA
jgi:hypothetical protein